MDLYATGRAPERLEPDAQKILRAGVREVFEESDSYPIYEGRIGASPREMRVVMLDAAQSQIYKIFMQCLKRTLSTSSGMTTTLSSLIVVLTSMRS
ncbi:hypothetical protein [Salmonella enterica]|uniref:Uncharacterized protein n=1 Tax=Salmonella enterica subsp. enterica serovar Dessau TaxID=2564349 RepID=A0A8E5IMJ9_SALET|nr:hypothetical protein [Salmonella enterica]QUS47117.1 hypothetical protein F1331_26465 [Salmonella enterica subsp. enterica serovar Dessau]